jgi:hypothetical protein
MGIEKIKGMERLRGEIDRKMTGEIGEKTNL